VPDHINFYACLAQSAGCQAQLYPSARLSSRPAGIAKYFQTTPFFAFSTILFYFILNFSHQPHPDLEVYPVNQEI
jgi:hypothetical protein